MKHHAASGMVNNLYQLILIENEMLFPSVRRLEEYVIKAKNKPYDIVEKYRKSMDDLTDDNALSLIESYKNWTSYNYPKDFQFVANNFDNPWEFD